MSTTVDERVVEMRFDNKHFESNVATSMSTLDKLKQKLNLSGASKGLEDIDRASKKVNMSGLGGAVESVGVKFSALQVIGVTALANITNSAVNAGKQLVKSLSVDQLSAGWQKFSDKTTSVATLVAQGNALEDVNDQLDRLNWFTDETSYNFTEMVSNIAKFTATGKGLLWKASQPGQLYQAKMHRQQVMRCISYLRQWVLALCVWKTISLSRMHPWILRNLDRSALMLVLLWEH